MTITADALSAGLGIAPGQAASLVERLNEGVDRFNILNPSLWVANLSHESGRFGRLEENLNYSVEALLSLFGRHRISAEDAAKYGRSAAHPADQEALADILYGGDFGRKNLGNTEPKDGSKFKGRSWPQLTGRAAYRELGLSLPFDKPLLDAPEALAEPKYGGLAGGWFWTWKRCNQVAREPEAVRRRWNGGTFGLAEVLAHYDKLREAGCPSA